jgi:hypothetical protein
MKRFAIRNRRDARRMYAPTDAKRRPGAPTDAILFASIRACILLAAWRFRIANLFICACTQQSINIKQNTTSTHFFKIMTTSIYIHEICKVKLKHMIYVPPSHSQDARVGNVTRRRTVQTAAAMEYPILVPFIFISTTRRISVVPLCTFISYIDYGVYI